MSFSTLTRYALYLAALLNPITAWLIIRLPWEPGDFLAIIQWIRQDLDLGLLLVASQYLYAIISSPADFSMVCMRQMSSLDSQKIMMRKSPSTQQVPSR